MTEKTLMNGFGLFSKPPKPAFEIGENGTTEEVKQRLAALTKASTDGPTLFYFKREDATSLLNGAMAALRQHNRPENLQGVLPHFSSKKCDYFDIIAFHRSDFKTITEDELNILHKDLPAEQRQEHLNTLLDQCVVRYGYSPSGLMKTLIKTGADPKMNDHHALREAARNSDTDMVKFLHDRDVDFDAAIKYETLHCRTTNDNTTLKNLQIYQQELTGKISNYDPAVHQKMAALQQNVQDLTQKCETLEQQLTNKGQKPGMRRNTKTVPRRNV